VASLSAFEVKNGMQNTMRVSSEAHKELFCRNFIATHREFDPEKLPWPDLDGPALDRLHGLPFWEEAIATEIEAGVKISAYAAQVRDPLLRPRFVPALAEPAWRSLHIVSRPDKKHCATMS
jgi:hypothetical protein